MERRLTPGDHFLLLATDGLWDMVGNDDAMGLVMDTVKHPDMCAKRLAMESLTRGEHLMGGKQCGRMKV